MNIEFIILLILILLYINIKQHIKHKHSPNPCIGFVYMYRYVDLSNNLYLYLDVCIDLLMYRFMEVCQRMFTSCGSEPVLLYMYPIIHIARARQHRYIDPDSLLHQCKKVMSLLRLALLY